MPTLAKELNIRVEVFYRWRQELLNKKEARFPGRGNASLSPLEAENARLNKQLKEAEVEREILNVFHCLNSISFQLISWSKFAKLLYTFV